MSSSAETFSKDWPSKPGWTDDDLIIEQVFYSFDEPMFFSVRLGPMLLILQKTAARHGNLYFGSMVAPEIVDAMTADRISVRAAMKAGPVYVLEMHGMKVVRHWSVAPASIPSAWWPAEGICLTDQANSATDTPSLILGKTGLRLDDGCSQKGDGFLEVMGDGFTISLAPNSASSLWKFIASFLPETRQVRHLKRGSEYDVMNESVSVQCTEAIREGDILCFYVEENGKGWARPQTEFNDGRFTNI
jgi:hypothetical protein